MESSNNSSINDNKNWKISGEKFRTLLNIPKYINSDIEKNKLLNIIIKTATYLVDGETSSLMLLDKNNNRLMFYSVSSNRSVLHQFSFPADQGIAGEVIRKGKPVVIDDVQNYPQHFDKVDKEINFITRNIIAVPMKREKQVVGLLEVLNSKNRDRFEKSDVELLQYLADQSALAIINRDLIQNAKEKAEELSALYELSQASAFANTIDDLFIKAVNILNKIFKVKTTVIINKFNIKQKSKVYKSKDYNIQLNTTKIFLDQTNKDIEYHPREDMDVKNICSMTIPLIAQDEVVGVLGIGDLSQTGQFSEMELRLLSTTANQISDACENIRLLLEEEEKNRIEKEVEIMRDLQQGIIPKKFPEYDIMDITGYNHPAYEVGGDFYDIFKLSDDKIGFVIADVSGKGASAGLFMALSRSIVKVFALNENSPAMVLKKSNNVIIEDSKNGMFVTLFYSLIDLKKKKIIISNGGHNRQIYYSKKENICKFLYLKGRPLGVLEDSTYEEKEIDFYKGDILFLFTDGINEAINSNFIEFGDEKLLSIILENADNNVSTIKEVVIDELKKFVGETEQMDDITMLIIKFK